MQKFFTLLILFALSALLTAQTTTNSDNVSKVRGNWVRNEVRKVNRTPQFTCSLAIDSRTNQPVLRLSKQIFQVSTEVRIYEALERLYYPDGRSQYQPIRGEFIDGETTQKANIIKLGALANTKVTINRKLHLKTDAEGNIPYGNGQLDILEQLDALNKHSVNFNIAVDGYPPLDYTVYRTMPQRKTFDEKRLEEPAHQDVLVAYGLDFSLSRQKPEQEDLKFTLVTPSPRTTVLVDERFKVTVRVENTGTTVTSCLIGRIFSRLPELNGKLFFFGAIKPGEAREFTRFVKIDDTNLTQRIFAEIHFSDSWSALKQSLPLELNLIR